MLIVRQNSFINYNIEITISLHLLFDTIFRKSLDGIKNKSNAFGLYGINAKKFSKLPFMSKNITIKKIIMGSQEDINSDAGFVEGTPQYRWDKFWELVLATNAFTKHYADFSKPLRRDVVNIVRN